MIGLITLRVRAVIALSAFLGSLALPLVTFGHLALDDDSACGSVALSALAKEPAAAQMQAPAPVAPPEHCALCHWLRAVGGSQTCGVVSTQPEWLLTSIAPLAASVWRAGPSLDHLAPRGPPSSDPAL